MLSRAALPAGLALLGATRVLAGQATCSLQNKCPEETPCCSQYGQCGVGAYCLGGCDPRMSFSLDSCMPAPVCQDRTFKMDSLDGIVEIDKYLGDPSKADWVFQGEPVAYNGNLLLTMPPNSVGTVLASTVYMWYGSVKAKLKTSRSAGVVTAFILLSDVKDEIDYEFVGTELTTAQTNYYFQGIPNYDNSANISLSDTYANWHEYEIRWTPDDITWLVDGQVGRVKKRSDTWNATANRWDFPQTPSRVQLSIWPGGASSNAEGTVSWAGGPIDWKNTPDMKSPGYYYATFGEISIQCYNATSPPGTNTGKSYTFNNVQATNNTIVDGDKDTVLGSFLATGQDPSKGATKSSGTASASSSSDVASIPGGSSSGTGSSSGAAANQNSGSSSSSGSSNSSSSSGSSSSSCGSGSSFTQNCGSTSSSSGSGASTVAERMGASALAGVVAVAALLAL